MDSGSILPMTGVPCCCINDPPCCLEPTDYPNWNASGNCCRICERTIVGDPWTLICSDPIRTDTRFAEAVYKYYTTSFLVINGPVGVVPPCPTTKTLCATITESHTVEVVERLMLRYRKISQSSSVTKIQIVCGDSPRACRWVVIRFVRV